MAPEARATESRCIGVTEAGISQWPRAVHGNKREAITL
jgi:hypothetical protein